MPNVLVTHSDEPLGRRVVKLLWHDERIGRIFALGSGAAPRAFDTFRAGMPQRRLQPPCFRGQVLPPSHERHGQSARGREDHATGRPSQGVDDALAQVVRGDDAAAHGTGAR